MGAEKQSRRLPGLDGLRALAALSVFLVHFNQIVRPCYVMGPFDLGRVLSDGNHGVALFFILSGFLLSRPFWQATAAGESMPGALPFAARRIGRIVPGYYFALTSLILLTGFWRIPGALPDILLHYLFLFNAAEFSIFSINPPFWTLAVEMQFYLLLPLLFVLARRLGGGKAAAAFIFLGLLAYGANALLVDHVTRIVYWPLDPWRVWIRPHGAVVTHSLLAHLPHFLLGVSTGWLFVLRETGGPLPEALRNSGDRLFMGAFFLVIFLVGTGLTGRLEVPFGRYTLPVIPALMAAMVFSAPHARRAGRWLDGFFLGKLGAVSYGIYIYHLPVLNWVDRQMTIRGLDAAEHGFLFGSAALFITVLSAGLSFFLIERPAMNMIRKRF